MFLIHIIPTKKGVTKATPFDMGVITDIKKVSALMDTHTGRNDRI